MPIPLMTPTKLAAYVARVRAYLHSDEGRRNLRQMMNGSHRICGGRPWPYARAVAESVRYVTRLVIYERISAVTDEVIIAELSREPGEAA